jgi:hypothetical protein
MMKAVGLVPSDTGQPGGREVGQKVSATGRGIRKERGQHLLHKTPEEIPAMAAPGVAGSAASISRLPLSTWPALSESAVGPCG